MTELHQKLKQAFCSHKFKGTDMRSRNSDGIVKWPCCKCGKEFAAEYGLDILKYGECIGEWGGYTPIGNSRGDNNPPKAE